MNRKTSLFARWYNMVAFWCGSMMVAVGVALHFPMFWMGRKTGFRLVGMPMDTGMLVGMALILLGVIATAYGLLPPRHQHGRVSHGWIAPPEDAPLTKAHWIQIGLIGIALVIDVMKAATLGFVIPGMRTEYGLGSASIAVLPVVALTGTTVGSFIWGALADIYGRRASILLAAVMFVGTSICGAMPSFSWNVFMCFMMGLAAGGMLPVANALLAEIMPTKHPGVVPGAHRRHWHDRRVLRNQRAIGAAAAAFRLADHVADRFSDGTASDCPQSAPSRIRSLPA